MTRFRRSFHGNSNEKTNAIWFSAFIQRHLSLLLKEKGGGTKNRKTWFESLIKRRNKSRIEIIGRLNFTKETAVNMIKILFSISAFLIAPITLNKAYAQNYPARPITLVVPFAAGGSTDVTARQLASGLQKVLGQSVVVENKTGAGGNLAAAAVAKSKPDGYTFLVSTNAHTAAVALYPKLQYDLKKELIPVAQIVSLPNLLVVPNDFPAKNLKEFADYVRAKKGNLRYGTAGNGTSQHLTTGLLSRMLNGEMTHVPYRGGAPASLALMTGEVNVLFTPIIEVLPHVQGGKMRAIAVSTKERSPLLPDVPAVGEVVQGYEVQMWSGLMAPAGTPQSIIQRVHSAVQTVMKSPEITEKISKQGLRVFDLSLDKLSEFYDKEIELWGNMVKVSGVKLD